MTGACPLRRQPRRTPNCRVSSALWYAASRFFRPTVIPVLSGRSHKVLPPELSPSSPLPSSNIATGTEWSSGVDLKGTLSHGRCHPQHGCQSASRCFTSATQRRFLLSVREAAKLLKDAYDKSQKR